MKATISVQAKCNDCCAITITAGNIVKEKDGYVPKFMPGGGGDYLTFDIDNETGRILNWTPLTKDQIEELEDL